MKLKIALKFQFLYLTLYVYLLFSVLLLWHLLPTHVPDYLIAYLTGTNYYILPFLFGLCLYDALERFLKLGKLMDPTSKYVFSFFLGYLTLSLIIIIFANAPFWNTRYFALLLLSLIGIWIGNQLSCVFKTQQDDCSRKDEKGLFLPQRVYESAIVILLLLIGFVNMFIYLQHLPPPLLDDVRIELREAIYLSQGDSLPYSIFSWGGSSDRYPTIAITGLISSLCNCHPIYVYYGASIALPYIFVLGIYLSCLEITRSRLTALFASSIAPVISKYLSYRLNASAMVIYFSPLVYVLISRLVKRLTIAESKAERRYFCILLLFSQILPVAFLLADYFSPSVFVYPNVVAIALLTLLIFPFIIIEDCKKRAVFFISSVVHIYLAWHHIINATFIVAFLFIVILIELLLEHVSTRGLVIYGLILSSLFLFIFMQVKSILTFPSNFILSSFVWGERFKGSPFDINTIQKWDRITKNVQTQFAFLCFLLSLLLVPLSVRTRRKSIIAFSAASIFVLFVLFFPEGHFFRVTYILLPLSEAILISSMFVYVPLHIIEQFSSSCKLKNLLKLKAKLVCMFKRECVTVIATIAGITKAILVLVILILWLSLLVQPLYTNRVSYINSLRSLNPDGFSSIINYDEVVCALYIFTHTPKTWVTVDYFTYEPKGVAFKKITWSGYQKYIPKTNDTLIISDPATMAILNAWTARDTPLYEVSGMIIRSSEAEYSPYSLQVMDYLKHKIFLAKTPEEAYNSIQKIRGNHKPVLIVISGRTYAWIKSDRHFTGKNPAIDINSLKQEFRIFFDEKYFRQVFSTDKMIVIEVKL